MPVSNVDVTFDVYLYQYARTPFDVLANDKEGKPSIKDLEDVRLNNKDFNDALNVTTERLTTLHSQVPALKPNGGAPEPIRSALQTNLLLQQQQAVVDDFNWLRTVDKDFWKKFKNLLAK